MRAQNHGTIVLNSGGFGLYPIPGGALYNSTKAAIDMVHETLKVELSPFNIRTIIVNAGLQRTNVTSNAMMPKNGFGQEYVEKTAVGQVLGIVGSISQDPELSPGDPQKFGDRIVEVVDGVGYGKELDHVTRVILGRDGMILAEKKLENLQAEVKASKKIATTTDFEGTTAEGVAAVVNF